MILKKILLIIALIFLMALNVFAQTGSYTSHDIFYLPLYGAYGTDEYDQYNTYMEIADQLIWDNKTAIEAIEADYLVAADLTDYYTKLEIDAFGYITDLSGFDTDDLVEGSVNKYFPGFTSLLADYGFTDNSTEWDLAYGWGDHAAAGYLTTVALNDISDVNTTGVADGKIIKYDIATSKWIIADDEDTGTTYTAGTGLDLTGTVFSLDASAFDLNDFPADPDADRYLFWNDTTGAITWAEGSGSGVTTFVGLTDTPLAYTGYAGYFPKVNAGETALEFAELTESDITDLGTYLTSESDPVFTASDVYSVTTADITNWDTAYGWGDWSGEGFITGVAWGDITGTLSNQTDLNTALGNKLANVSEDTTPEAGGNFVMGDYNITGIGRASFTQELDNGSKTTNFTIDFSTDQKQKVTLTANTMTLTLDTTSVGVANYLLKIVNGGLATLTWAAETGSVYWPGGTEPTLTSSGTDIVTFYFDGTDWYCMAGLDFK
ncbi:MAG: hypothetical protein GXY51_02495 [Bacteroidetes bacterium]|nr:hypothetical protein [Bacteroidota bacterium]